MCFDRCSVLSSLAILKGKPLMGLLGVILPPVSIVGFIRLASPTSYWARRFYDSDGPKMARSKERFAKIKERHLRWVDAIAGAPGLTKHRSGEPGTAAAERAPVD